jgi:hypothetical protein
MAWRGGVAQTAGSTIFLLDVIRVTVGVCEKIAQNVTQPIFGKN